MSATCSFFDKFEATSGTIVSCANFPIVTKIIKLASNVLKAFINLILLMIFTKASYIISNPDHSACPKPDRPEYAFIGRSNVGKSSLINMLTGIKNLAKTSKLGINLELHQNALTAKYTYSKVFGPAMSSFDVVVIPPGTKRKRELTKKNA